MTFHQRFKTTEERFSEKYSVAANGCWEWRSERGLYPKFWTGDGYERATRFIWQRVNGVSLTSDQHLCHKCDNPRCVNPEHLFVGSHADNMQDKARKGRASRCVGEANGQAKLTALDVSHIKRWRECGFSQQKIADAYGVTQTHISEILTGKAWAA